MKIAFDIELMRPACVLVAAGMGASSSVAHRFPTETWLLVPTENMKVYEITDDQLSKLVMMVRFKQEERRNDAARSGKETSPQGG